MLYKLLLYDQKYSDIYECNVPDGAITPILAGMEIWVSLKWGFKYFGANFLTSLCSLLICYILI